MNTGNRNLPVGSCLSASMEMTHGYFHFSAALRVAMSRPVPHLPASRILPSGPISFKSNAPTRSDYSPAPSSYPTAMSSTSITGFHLMHPVRFGLPSFRRIVGLSESQQTSPSHFSRFARLTSSLNDPLSAIA